MEDSEDDNYHSLSSTSSTEQIGVIFQTPPMDPEVMREMSRAIADGMRQGMLSKELLRNPTVYVGDRKKPELLFIFLDQVERFGKSHGFQNAELVPYAGKSLGGDAYLWYAANEDRLLNGGWDYFVRSLKLTYLHPNFQQDLLVKLENGKQRGSAVAYSDEFQKLYRMVDSYYHQETIARHWFFSGLKDHVKAAIIGLYLNPAVPLSEIIQAAIVQDQLLFPLYKPLLQKTGGTNGYGREPNPYDNYNYQNNMFQDMNFSGGQNARVDSDGDIIMSQMQIRKLSPKERKYLQENGGCFVCRKLGHKLFTCPYKQRNASDEGYSFTDKKVGFSSSQSDSKN